ncbi:hypothetical protein BBP40_006630 [Aspergillus hancockii]|nr:hypothetical protein BBP40_006630 [Aspergillus hancockii]
MPEVGSSPGVPYKAGLNHVGYATLVVCILFTVLSAATVGLRLWTRKVTGYKIGVDDWLIIASWFVFLGFCSNILVGVYTTGGGQVYTDASVAQKKFIQYMQSEYAIPPLYAIDVTLVKMSILVFYRRLFPTAPFQRINVGVIIFCIIWFVVAIIGDILYCIPVRQFWDATAHGSCFNFPIYFLAMELVDLLLDVVIIGLPMKTILGLQLSLRKRLALLGVFLLGAFVIVTGAVRIAYIYKPGNQLLAPSLASLWSVINLGVAIICACLPIYRPWLTKVSPLRALGRKKNHQDAEALHFNTSSSSVPTRDPRSEVYYRTGDGAMSLTKVEAVPQEPPGSAFTGIRVQREIEVV